MQTSGVEGIRIWNQFGFRFEVFEGITKAGAPQEVERLA